MQERRGLVSLLPGREAAGVGTESAMTLPGWALGPYPLCAPLGPWLPASLQQQRQAVVLDDHNHLAEYRPRTGRCNMVKG
jgi:hypothetical protein